MKFRLPAVMTAVFVLGVLLVVPQGNTVQAGFNYHSLNQIQKRILSGFAEFELNPANAENGNSQPANYNPKGSGDCVVNLALS